MSSIAVQKSETPTVRPLNILASLIKSKWQEAQEAAERAAEPFYIEIGELLNEAKSQMSQGEFLPWVERNFDFGERQARRYMKAVIATNHIQNGRRRPQSISAAIGEPVPSERPNTPQFVVREKIQSFNFDRFNQEEATKQKERDLVRKLCLEIIDIGYRVLATKMHPDKPGGSEEAFQAPKDRPRRPKGEISMSDLTTVVVPEFKTQRTSSEHSPVAQIARQIKENGRLSIENIARGLYPSSHKGNVRKARNRTTEILKYGLAHDSLLIKEFARQIRYGKEYGPQQIIGMRVYSPESASTEDMQIYFENRRRLQVRNELTRLQIEHMDQLAGVLR